MAALALALAVLPGTVLRSDGPQGDDARRLSVRAIAGPAIFASGVGPFRFVGAWQLASTDRSFGGYSALVPLPPDRLLLISDRGGWLELTAPDSRVRAPHRMGHIMRLPADRTGIADAEAALMDPSGHLWLAWEDRRALSRFAPGWRAEQRVFPPAMKDWPAQFGAEAMARLPDGRLVVVAEAFAPDSAEHGHKTLVFAADPFASAPAPTPRPAEALLNLPAGFRPTDMAVLPDGRVLVLLRQLVWPLPLRFAARIALADPVPLARTGRWQGKEIARIAEPLPTENYEGIALRPRADGLLDVWLVADDNRAATQRTLLLKFTLDPADLPPRR